MRRKFAFRNLLYSLGIPALFVVVHLHIKLNEEWQLMENKIWQLKDLDVPPDFCPKTDPCAGPMLLIGGICKRVRMGNKLFQVASSIGIAASLGRCTVTDSENLCYALENSYSPVITLLYSIAKKEFNDANYDPQ